MSQEKNCYWLVPGSLCGFVDMGYHSIVYLSINLISKMKMILW